MLERIMPYIGLGLLIVLLVFSFIFLFYLFIFGAIVGLVLFAIAWIRTKLLSNSTSNISTRTHQHQGRVYDHDET